MNTHITHDLVAFDHALSRISQNQHNAAQTAYEARQQAAEDGARAEAQLRKELLALVAGNDLDAVATFERPRTDWANRRKDGTYPGRAATLYDVIADTVELRDYSKRLIGLFIRAANGSHIAEDARELMEDMATMYASMNVEE